MRIEVGTRIGYLEDGRIVGEGSITSARVNTPNADNSKKDARKNKEQRTWGGKRREKGRRTKRTRTKDDE